jgi:hypothetical protein
MFHRAWMLGIVLLSARPIAAAEVTFDVPASIECHDVTPESFAEAHPMLKVIEAKFRISARVVGGDAAEIVDFLYELTSDDKRMRFQDYLPNTTLESTVADDQIEVTDSSESAKATGAEAHVTYKVFALGGSHNQSSKKSQCNHYKQLAAKELVLASGTINREHGVFFRLRPSRSGSLEGAKEFTFLASVPVTWRGDLCAIACKARAKKTTFLSSSVAEGGASRSTIGMYLAGDDEAAELAEQLHLAQEACATAVAVRAAKDNVFDALSAQTVSLLSGKKSPQTRQDAERAQKAVRDLTRPAAPRLSVERLSARSSRGRPWEQIHVC